MKQTVCVCVCGWVFLCVHLYVWLTEWVIEWVSVKGGKLVCNLYNIGLDLLSKLTGRKCLKYKDAKNNNNNDNPTYE